MIRTEKLWCGDGPPCPKGQICVRGKCVVDPAPDPPFVEDAPISNED